MRKIKRRHIMAKKQTTKANNVKSEAKVDVKYTFDDKARMAAENAVAKNKNVQFLAVTGYTGLKFANKTLIEFHFKKKSISHITVAKNSKVYELLKANDLITRVVPDSYGWKLNTECIFNPKLIGMIDKIVDMAIQEAEEARNLKEAKKQPAKKVANAK